MEKIKIKQLSMYRSDGANDEKLIQHTREYDANGNKIKELAYSEDGELMEEKYWSYNQHNQLVEEKFLFLEEEVTEVIQHFYNEKGQLDRSSKSYGEEGDADQTYYVYAADGKLVEKRTESVEGEVEHKELMHYQGDLLISHHIYNYDGSLMESFKYSYNANKELVEELHYSSERDQELKILYDYPIAGKHPDTTVYNNKGNIVQRQRHFFDEKNRLIKEVNESVDGQVKKMTSYYGYDESDNLTEFRIVDKFENLLSKIWYKHNNFNLLSEEIHYDYPEKDLELLSFTHFFEYDYF